ncbi:MAG: DUF2589 domain-containing protein [Roseburia sp.]
MAISLSNLIEQIGTAVQDANAMLEQRALVAYLGQGYERVTENGDEEEFVPVSYTIQIPSAGEKRKLQVPITALMHHNSLQLVQVDVKLRFLPEEGENGELMISPQPMAENSSAYSLSELSLQFGTTAPAEGTARIHNRQIQNL